MTEAIYVGLMSGTSVDAIDAVCVELTHDAVCVQFQTASGALPTNKLFEYPRLSFKMLGTATQTYPESLRQRLLACMQNQPVALAELCSLNVEVAEVFAQTALMAIQQAGLTQKEIRAIGSHGQTVYHLPPDQAQKLGLKPSTLQIAEASVIAARTGIETIADFRPADMAVGGQGAPLVCLADWLLLRAETTGRCVQNIGGIGNVTVLPAATCSDALPFAFDTGPGNMLMDLAMQALLDQPYDADGQTALQGQVSERFLSRLLAEDAYLLEPLPKTTGRERYGQAYFKTLQGWSETQGLSAQDWLATLNRFTAESIAQAYERFVFPKILVTQAIVGGGGAKNPVLMGALQSRLPQLSWLTHENLGISSQYKEALAFAVLAWATINGLPGNVPSCTGAKQYAVLGKQALPPLYGAVPWPPFME